MNRLETTFGRGWLAMIIFSLVLALSGCEGDDGAVGPIGPEGPEGTAGTNGSDGPPGPAASVTPLESCAVCHSDGSYVSATAAHEVFGVGSFADFAVAPIVDTTDLRVSFSVTVDGAPATSALFGRAYVSVGGIARTQFVTANPDPDELLITFSNDSGGNYSITIPDGVTLFGGAEDQNRFLVIVEVGANELEVAAVGDYPNPIPLAGLASSEACVNCHGPSGEGNGTAGRFNPLRRGGHYSAPMSAQACVVCHRPDDPATPEDDEEPSYMQLFRVVHGIHNSHNFPGGKFVSDRNNVYDVTYPTYTTNCSVCHSADTIVPAVGVSALAAANAMPVSGRGCFSCHGSMENDSWDFTGFEFHLTNIPDPVAFDCTTNCHRPDGIASDKVVVADFHNGYETERHGFIYDGVDTSVVEGAKFDWAITSMADNGEILTFTWQASYNGVGVNPCNETVGLGEPTFHLGGGGLRTYRSYAQGDDFIIGTSTSAPGQPTRVNLSAENTTCVSNVATTTIPVESVAAEKGRLALGGKPRVLSADVPDLTVEARVPSPTFDWLVGDGAEMERRGIVDTTLCLKCHVGSLYQHGGDRVDNVDYCLLCHNAASNEMSVRVGMGVDASEAYDGKVGETFEMKTMLHRIHSAGTEGSPPYVVYRNRGIYGFATDDSLLPNWPGTGPQVVFGSNDVTTTHNFHTPTYPRALNACTACHEGNTVVLPDQTQAMANTVDPGSEVWEDQLDDVLQGAATTACITCHADGPAKGHAYQNSWDPQEFEEGRKTIIEAVR